MNISPAPQDQKAWNAFIEAHFPPVGAFMETWEWGEFQKNMGRSVERYIVEEHGKQVACFALTRFMLPGGLSYGYAPRGPVIAGADDEARVTAVICAIQEWAREHLSDLMFLRLEPPVPSFPAGLESCGFQEPSFYIQPRHNAVVLLPKDDAEIAASFHPATRSNLHRAEKRGVTVVVKSELSDEDCSGFQAMIADTVTRNSGVNAYPGEEYFKAFFDTIPFLKGARDPKSLSMLAFCGYRDGSLASMHFVLFFGKTATYLYGASRTEHLNSKVDTYLHWSAMREGVKQGCLYYDLGGVDPKRWPSLTTFKSQFRGQVFDYAGNLDIPLRKHWYRAYALLKHVGL